VTTTAGVQGTRRSARLQSILAAAAAAAPCAAQAPPPAAQPVPKISLVAPGGSPRQVLRLAPRAGASQVFDVSMRMESTQTVSGREMTADAIPGLRFAFRTTVRQAAPGGEVVYDAECVGADAFDVPGAPASDPALVEQARASLQALLGLRGSGHLTDRGVSRGTTFDVPADADLQSQVQMLERLLDQSVPLPQEPVGPGGSWRMVTSLHDQGVPVTQTSVYTLKGFDGAALLIDLAVTQEAVIPAPDGEENVRIANYTSRGSGSIRMRLDRAFPDRAAADIVTESTWVAGRGAQVQQMQQRSRMVIELAGR
jgi:hypothetical protein